MFFRSPLLSLVLSVAFLVMFATVPALADGIHSPGPPVDGNSWSTPVFFDNFTGIPYDTVESFIIFDTGAGPFDGIGMRNFGDAGLYDSCALLDARTGRCGYSVCLRFIGQNNVQMAKSSVRNRPAQVHDCTLGFLTDPNQAPKRHVSANSELCGQTVCLLQSMERPA